MPLATTLSRLSVPATIAADQTGIASAHGKGSPGSDISSGLRANFSATLAEQAVFKQSDGGSNSSGGVSPQSDVPDASGGKDGGEATQDVSPQDAAKGGNASSSHSAGAAAGLDLRSRTIASAQRLAMQALPSAAADNSASLAFVHDQGDIATAAQPAVADHSEHAASSTFHAEKQVEKQTAAGSTLLPEAATGGMAQFGQVVQNSAMRSTGSSISVTLSYPENPARSAWFGEPAGNGLRGENQADPVSGTRPGAGRTPDGSVSSRSKEDITSSPADSPASGQTPQAAMGVMDLLDPIAPAQSSSAMTSHGGPGMLSASREQAKSGNETQEINNETNDSADAGMRDPAAENALPVSVPGHGASPSVSPDSPALKSTSSKVSNAALTQTIAAAHSESSGLRGSASVTAFGDASTGSSIVGPAGTLHSAASVGAVWIDGREALALVGAFNGIFFAALELAAPVVAATVLVEMSVAVMGKLSPQLPVMMVAIPAKTLVGYLTLIGSLALWPRFIAGRFSTLLDHGEQWMRHAALGQAGRLP